nr:Chain C, HIV-based altered-peptide ligand KVAEIVHFL [Homo sapiens]3V5H_F Chain F, HIV-based altered-peptide ligand KVAEIVHFL [Homo sapiens]
KVAEIVHFL